MGLTGFNWVLPRFTEVNRVAVDGNGRPLVAERFQSSENDSTAPRKAS